jgi:hypothetical protein
MQTVWPKLGLELSRFQPKLRAGYDRRSWREAHESQHGHA